MTSDDDRKDIWGGDSDDESGVPWNGEDHSEDDPTDPDPEETESSALIPFSSADGTGSSPDSAEETLGETLKVGHASVIESDEARRVVRRLADKRRGGDRVYMIVGVTATGKTAFSWRLKDIVTSQQHRDFQRYRDRTQPGFVNFVDIPKYPLLFDIAGEDFEILANEAKFKITRSDAYLSDFLWPGLREVDGLLILVDFPAAWYDWNVVRAQAQNNGSSPTSQELSRLAEGVMREKSLTPATALRTLAQDAEATESLIQEAVKRLIQMTTLSRNWGQLQKDQPDHFKDQNGCPSFEDIENTAHAAPNLDIPVFVALSKADVFTCKYWPDGMFPPDEDGLGGQTVDPDFVSPRRLVQERLPDLYLLLRKKVRHFAFGYTQSFDGEGKVISDSDDKKQLSSFLGHEPILSFLDSHPWHLGPPLLTAGRLNAIRAFWDGAWGR